MKEQHVEKERDKVKLYSTHEVIQKTGIKAYRLRYLDETGKVVPVKRTAGMRYYSEEQLYSLMKMMKRPIEVAYICVDCRGIKDISMEDVMENLKKSKETMGKRLEALEIKTIEFITDLVIDDMEKSNTEKLVNKAKEGLLSKVYVASDIGFPADLMGEYNKWFGYLGVEVIDLVEQEEQHE